jgi:phosphoenolpyruvate phosphomutase
MSHAAAKLRELLARPGPVVIIGAHNGLSARLGVEAGFDGLWASGFEISASYGIPDANILTMAENLDAAKMMCDVVDAPIVADCDNGYGNAINVIRCVEEYERAGIAAICIEDNVFPKRCSFYAGVQRELATVEEHAGKIRAAKNAQRTRDFTVIARTEALIAGWGMDEALKRARAYADAGADMLLIHSKSKSPDEVMTFAARWDRPTALVCVPTIYKGASASELHEAGYKMVIFANHGIRAAIKAMTETFATLRTELYAGAVDDTIAPLERVYQIIGVDKMKHDEKAFMPAQSEGVTAVVLAAGASPTLMPLVEDRPKAMLDIKGRSILARQVEVLNACGVKNIAVVRGYLKDAVDLPNVRYYDNDDYASSGELQSLLAARDELDRAFALLYGDILFEEGHLQKLLKSSADVTILVDRAWNEAGPDKDRGVPDLVVLEDAQETGYRFVGAERPHRVKRISSRLAASEGHGEFVGLALFSDRGARVVGETIARLEKEHSGTFHEAPSLRQAKLTDLLQELIDGGHDVQAVDVYKGWLEVDTFEDYRRAWALIK